jgi:hypothetical protein
MDLNLDCVSRVIGQAAKISDLFELPAARREPMMRAKRRFIAGCPGVKQMGIACLRKRLCT